jgi:hypothetical protein
MKTVFVVFDPVHPYTNFKVYQSVENAAKDLRSNGFTIDFLHDWNRWTGKDVPWGHCFVHGLVYKNKNTPEQRFLYSRLVEDCEENKNYLADKNEDLAC